MFFSTSFNNKSNASAEMIQSAYFKIFHVKHKKLPFIAVLT